MEETQDVHRRPSPRYQSIVSFSHSDISELHRTPSQLPTLRDALQLAWYTSSGDSLSTYKRTRLYSSACDMPRAIRLVHPYKSTREDVQRPQYQLVTGLDRSHPGCNDGRTLPFVAYNSHCGFFRRGL